MTGSRRLTVTAASSIAPRSTHWVWANWLPVGAFSLLGGREGTGKSTIGYERASKLTRGKMPGKYAGTPKAVIVCATEDSWSRTIIPRLMAHNADLDLIYRVDVETVEGFDGALSLPTDLDALETLVEELDVRLILLDPLLSRLDENLDTHKDAEVRLALEPLAALADRCGANVLGIIHVNKGTNRDALTSIMASRAFVAVARSVLYVMTDLDDATERVLGLAKNSLGKLDVPGYKYHIEGVSVGLDSEGDEVTAGRIEWSGTSEQSVEDRLRASEEDPEKRSAKTDAAAWLVDHLTAVGGREASALVKAEGKKVGHAEHTLKRALASAGVTVEEGGFPRTTWWVLDVESEQSERA
jgi:hypothetical protein